MATVLRVCAPAHFVLFKESQELLWAHYYLQKRQHMYIIWKTPNRINSQGRISVYIDWFFNFWAKEIHCAQQKTELQIKEPCCWASCSRVVLSDCTAGLHLSLKLLGFNRTGLPHLLIFILYKWPFCFFSTCCTCCSTKLLRNSHSSSLGWSRA